MVVFKIDIQSVFARPAEGDPEISGHAHRPALRAALQAVEAIPGDVQVFGPPRRFQQLEDAHAFPDVVGANPARLASEVKLFKTFMPEPTIIL